MQNQYKQIWRHVAGAESPAACYRNGYNVVCPAKPTGPKLGTPCSGVCNTIRKLWFKYVESLGNQEFGTEEGYTTTKNLEPFPDTGQRGNCEFRFYVKG